MQTRDYNFTNILQYRDYNLIQKLQSEDYNYTTKLQSSDYNYTAKLQSEDYNFTNILQSGDYNSQSFLDIPPPIGGGKENNYYDETPMRLETGQAVETVAIAVEVNRHPHKPDNHIKRNNHRQRIHHQRVVKIEMKKIFEPPHRAARRAGVAGKIVKNTYSAVSRRIVVGRIAQCKI